MGDGYSRRPLRVPGALIQFSAAMIVPIPNIIIFQYNPESITRTLSPYDPKTAGVDRPTDPAAVSKKWVELNEAADAQPYDPTETFTLNLLIDSTDHLETPDVFPHQITVATGVADRLAALEMLLYPAGDSLIGGLLGTAATSVGFQTFGLDTKTKLPEPRKAVATTLFVWGPGRIVPVRLTSFTVEEVQFNQLLYPHRAKVAIGMRVVTSAEIRSIVPQKLEHDIAAIAYDFTRGQKEVLALANIANTIESIVVPFL
jgi:hypothetical protein